MVIVLFLVFVGVTQFSNNGVANFRYDKKVNEPSAELKKDPAKAEYVKKNITLASIGTLDEIEAGSPTPTKYIYGTIKNNGDKRIIKLQLTVYYFDKGGKLIAEGSIWPILGNKAKLDSIKPDSSRDFQFLVTGTVPGWSGKIRAKVSDVEFAD